MKLFCRDQPAGTLFFLSKQTPKTHGEGNTRIAKKLTLLLLLTKIFNSVLQLKKESTATNKSKIFSILVIKYRLFLFKVIKRKHKNQK